MKRRKSNPEFSVHVLLGFIMVLVLASVVFLMYWLGSRGWPRGW